VVTVEVIIGVVVVVVVILVWRYMRARSIVRRHSEALSRITGIPAKQISSEMINGNLTPGEWAALHGLDPMTFQPRAGFISERSDPPISIATLADRTGIPEDQIRREVIDDLLSPGEWAVRHGLDPLTFQPLHGDVPTGAHAVEIGGPPKGVDAEGQPTDSAVDRLRDLGDLPVASWTSCPVCMSPVVQASGPDVKACMTCFRVYTDRGIEPVGFNHNGTVGISGTKPYMPLLLAQSARAEYPKLVWLLRPPGAPSTFPPILPDDEFEERAFTS